MQAEYIKYNADITVPQDGASGYAVIFKFKAV